MGISSGLIENWKRDGTCSQV